ncbi:MAG: response regulator [Armatimonadetes bacterium]|nr:response regulator [Armatimonadota bacterium]
MILLTSVERSLDGRALREAGFDACLVKPPRRARLLDAVAGAWARRGRNDPGPASDRTPWRSARVLVVDDNAINARVALMVLESLGCRGEVAGDGPEAVARVAAGAYDLVLMDCQTPEETTAAIRAGENAARRLPIVGVTADVMPGTRQHCLEAGMDDCVGKPLAREELASLLDRWCPAATWGQG